MLTEEDINETTIEKLKARELEIEVLVAAIEQNLEENGYKVTNKVYSGSMQNGIRIHGKLSFRGCDKAEEYYNVLDEKKEDYLNFLDFRGMKSCFTRFNLNQIISNVFSSITKWICASSPIR